MYKICGLTSLDNLSFALLQGPHYALSTFLGSAIIKLFFQMSNYFEIFFSNVKIQRKLQKHNFLFLFDGNSRASCHMPIHHCRASIQ